MSKETTGKTITVALVLCIVCSLVVASAAVLLKDKQKANQLEDKQKNILAAAGLLVPGKGIAEQFEQVTTRYVDLDSGRYSDVVAAGYDDLKAAKDVASSTELSSANDLAKIGRRENVATVYLIETNAGLDKIILPIRGYGLWSTLYGFIALESDADTVAGLGFYQHGETPGLGGEVDNPNWKGIWPGKKVYNDGEVAIGLIKGTVNPASANIDHEIDGLAGATLTGRGVSNLVQFWLGDMGFQKFLTNLRTGEAG